MAPTPLNFNFAQPTPPPLPQNFLTDIGESIAANAAKLQDSLTNTLKSVNDFTKNSLDNLTGLNKGFESVSKSASTATQSIKTVHDSVDIFGLSLKGSTKELFQFGAAVGVIVGEFFNLQQQASLVTIPINGIKDAFEALEEKGRGLDIAQSIGVDTSGIQQLELFRAGVFGNTEALKAFRSESQKSGIDFSLQLTKLNTILKLNKEGITEVGNEAKKLSKELNGTVSSKDIVAGQYQIASAGFVKPDDSRKVAEASAQLSVVGFNDFLSTADLVTKSLRAYGLEASKAGDVAAKLQAVVEVGITTIPELAAGFSETAVTAKAFGISLDQLGAAVATITTQGASTPEALTGIEALFRSLANQTPQAAKALGELSLNGERVKFDLATVQAKGLGNALSDVFTAANGNISVIREIIPESRALQAALALAAQGGSLFASSLEAISDSSPSKLKELFGVVQEDPTIKFQSIATKAKELSTNIGSTFDGFIDGATESLDKFVSVTESISNLPFVKPLISAALIFGDVLGKVIGVVGSLGGAGLSFVGTLAAINLFSNLGGGLLTQGKLIKTSILDLKDYGLAFKQLIGIDTSKSVITGLSTQLDGLKEKSKGLNLAGLAGDQELQETSSKINSITGQLGRAEVAAAELKRAGLGDSLLGKNATAEVERLTAELEALENKAKSISLNTDKLNNELEKTEQQILSVTDAINNFQIEARKPIELKIQGIEKTVAEIEELEGKIQELNNKKNAGTITPEENANRGKLIAQQNEKVAEVGRERLEQEKLIREKEKSGAISATESQAFREKGQAQVDKVIPFTKSLDARTGEYQIATPSSFIQAQLEAQQDLVKQKVEANKPVLKTDRQRLNNLSKSLNSSISGNVGVLTPEGELANQFETKVPFLQKVGQATGRVVNFLGTSNKDLGQLEETDKAVQLASRTQNINNLGAAFGQLGKSALSGLNLAKDGLLNLGKAGLSTAGSLLSQFINPLTIGIALISAGFEYFQSVQRANAQLAEGKEKAAAIEKKFTEAVDNTNKSLADQLRLKQLTASGLTDKQARTKLEEEKQVSNLQSSIQNSTGDRRERLQRQLETKDFRSADTFLTQNLSQAQDNRLGLIGANDGGKGLEDTQNEAKRSTGLATTGAAIGITAAITGGFGLGATAAGATIGATLGSIAPGLGTLIGAGIGVAIGFAIDQGLRTIESNNRKQELVEEAVNRKRTELEAKIKPNDAITTEERKKRQDKVDKGVNQFREDANAAVTQSGLDENTFDNLKRNTSPEAAVTRANINRYTEIGNQLKEDAKTALDGLAKGKLEAGLLSEDLTAKTNELLAGKAQVTSEDAGRVDAEIKGKIDAAKQLSLALKEEADKTQDNVLKNAILRKSKDTDNIVDDLVKSREAVRKRLELGNRDILNQTKNGTGLGARVTSEEAGSAFNNIKTIQDALQTDDSNARNNIPSQIEALKASVENLNGLDIGQATEVSDRIKNLFEAKDKNGNLLINNYDPKPLLEIIRSISSTVTQAASLQVSKLEISGKRLQGLASNTSAGGTVGKEEQDKVDLSIYDVKIAAQKKLIDLEQNGQAKEKLQQDLIQLQLDKRNKSIEARINKEIAAATLLYEKEKARLGLVQSELEIKQQLNETFGLQDNEGIGVKLAQNKKQQLDLDQKKQTEDLIRQQKAAVEQSQNAADGNTALVGFNTSTKDTKISLNTTPVVNSDAELSKIDDERQKKIKGILDGDAEKRKIQEFNLSNSDTSGSNPFTEVGTGSGARDYQEEYNKQIKILDDEKNQKLNAVNKEAEEQKNKIKEQQSSSKFENAANSNTNNAGLIPDSHKNQDYVNNVFKEKEAALEKEKEDRLQAAIDEYKKTGNRQTYDGNVDETNKQYLIAKGNIGRDKEHNLGRAVEEDNLDTREARANATLRLQDQNKKKLASADQQNKGITDEVAKRNAQELQNLKDQQLAQKKAADLQIELAKYKEIADRLDFNLKATQETLATVNNTVDSLKKIDSLYVSQKNSLALIKASAALQLVSANETYTVEKKKLDLQEEAYKNSGNLTEDVKKQLADKRALLDVGFKQQTVSIAFSAKQESLDAFAAKLKSTTEQKLKGLNLTKDALNTYAESFGDDGSKASEDAKKAAAKISIDIAVQQAALEEQSLKINQEKTLLQLKQNKLQLEFLDIQLKIQESQTKDPELIKNIEEARKGIADVRGNLDSEIKDAPAQFQQEQALQRKQSLLTVGSQSLDYLKQYGTPQEFKTGQEQFAQLTGIKNLDGTGVLQQQQFGSRISPTVYQGIDKLQNTLSDQQSQFNAINASNSQAQDVKNNYVSVYRGSDGSISNLPQNTGNTTGDITVNVNVNGNASPETAQHVGNAVRKELLDLTRRFGG